MDSKRADFWTMGWRYDVMERWAIVNVNLQYKIPKNVKTEQQIKDFVNEVELPDNYLVDSVEFVKVVEE